MSILPGGFHISSCPFQLGLPNQIHAWIQLKYQNWEIEYIWIEFKE